MATKEQRRRRVGAVSLAEWSRPEHQHLPVSRGELMSILTSYDAERWWRRIPRHLWQHLTKPIADG